uniref:Perforin 1.9 n=1 Tax=Sphaeramia orbicularis TaxID=375764 RepID=A0A672ZYE2_9TELE
MFLLNICICASLILSLPQCTLQSCTEGKPKECQDAEFAPGSTLGGEGFDITKIERKGAFVIDMNLWKRKDKTCTLCTNPYLENKRQKLPLSAVDWRAKQSCSMKVSSKLHRSSESLVSGSTASVENNWKANLDVDLGDKRGHLMLAGTHSKLAEYSMEKTKNDKYSFTSQSMTCEYYSYKVSNNPRVSKEFKRAVNKLPKIYSHENKQPFYQLIDNFGTHYITKVKLGGNVQSVTSIRQCQASLKGLSTEEVQMCLEVEASASTSKVKFDSEVKHCNKDLQKSDSSSSFSDLFNDRSVAYKEWLNTLPQNPDIISYSLNSLHELLPPKSQNPEEPALSHQPLHPGKGSAEELQQLLSVSQIPRCKPRLLPNTQGMARVIITVQRASGLWGDHTTATDGYVKVFLNKILVQRSPVIMNNNNPHWGMIVDLGSVDLSAGSRVRFEMWDQDSGWDDDLLGQSDLCVLQHGRLFYKWEVKCAPSLGGDSCTAYEPAPMKPSLKRWFVSRHAHPIPKSMLLKMVHCVKFDDPSGFSNPDMQVFHEPQSHSRFCV